MALSSSIVWECRASGANDNNGGGFKAGASGTDYSQQNSAQLTLTDLATTGVVTTLTSVTGGFTSAMVGNTINIASGTNFTAGFYEITAFTNSNTVTLDRAPTTAAGAAGTGSVGGALATLSKLAGAMVLSNKAYVTGAFTATATVTLAQATGQPSTVQTQTRVIGYGTTRGDSTHATLTLQTNTGLTGLNLTGTGICVEQIDVDCGSLGTSTGIGLVGNYDQCRNCKVSNFTTVGISITQTYDCCTDCEVTGGTSAATAAINLTGICAPIVGCFIHDNACPGIILPQNGAALHNLVVNNSGASSDGIRVNNNTTVRFNTCHNNGRDGIRNIQNNIVFCLWRDNLLTSNGGYGISGSVSGSPGMPASPDYDGNTFWNNTSGTRNLMDSTTGILGVSPYTNVKDVTLTGSPYVGPTTGASANFALNNTAGAGAACRGAGTPGTWQGNTGTTGYPDMGAAQHQDTGGGGGIMSNPSLEGVGS